MKLTCSDRMFLSLSIPLLLKMTRSDSTGRGIKTLTINNPNVDADYPCPPWYTYKDPSKYSSATGCHDPSQLPEQLVCDIDEGVQIQIGYYITYYEKGKIFQLNSCHYFQSEGYMN